MRTTPRTRHFSRHLTAPVTLLALVAAAAGVAAASPAAAAARPATAIPAAATAGTPATPALSRIEAQARHTQTKVIVRAAPGSLVAVAGAVKKLNGNVTRVLPAVNGLAATVPVTAVAKLQADRRVLSVTPDATGTAP